MNQQDDNFIKIMAILVTTIIITVIGMNLFSYRLDSLDTEIQQLVITEPFNNGSP